MASHELLDAVNRKDVRTTAEVAAVLGLEMRAAERELRAAQRAGLVAEEYDESVNVPPDFDRQYWHLTSDGFAEWDRLDAERGDG